MSYEAIEDGMKALLETVTGLKGNVRVEDYTLLGRGAAKAAIITYNGFNQRRSTGKGWHEIDWQIDVHIAARYQNETQVREALEVARQGVIDKIAAYPRLNGVAGILDTQVVRGERIPEEVTVGNVKFYTEVLVCIVTEEYEVTEEE